MQTGNRVRIMMTAVALLGVPALALACPVCFGNPSSAQTKGAQAGILALLIVTVLMLAAFGGFFFGYLRRQIRMFEESNGGSC
jgi:hypothetical protein